MSLGCGCWEDQEKKLLKGVPSLGWDGDTVLERTEGGMEKRDFW